VKKKTTKGEERAGRAVVCGQRATWEVTGFELARSVS